MNNPHAQMNRMHVRILLKEKQPDFAAILESIVQEFALGSVAPESCPPAMECLGGGPTPDQARPLARDARQFNSV